MASLVISPPNLRPTVDYSRAERSVERLSVYIEVQFGIHRSFQKKKINGGLICAPRSIPAERVHRVQS